MPQALVPLVVMSIFSSLKLTNLEQGVYFFCSNSQFVVLEKEDGKTETNNYLFSGVSLKNELSFGINFSWFTGTSMLLGRFLVLLGTFTAQCMNGMYG